MTILDVTDDAAGRAEFLRLPALVYAEHAVAEKSLDREVFHRRQRLFLAMEGGHPIARVVARLSPQLRGNDQRPYGMLGFYEALDHPAVSRELFRTAIDWLNTEGAGTIIGPMDGDTWHRYRLNIGPFDRPPFPMEPNNPPYYQRLWESAGFVPLESYSSKWVDDVSTILPHLAAGLRGSTDKGYRIRPLQPDRLRQELELVHDISTEIFEKNFLYTPITRHEFLSLYDGIERMLDPSLVLFAEGPEGEAVGFVFAFADPAQKAVHYKTIGVRRHHRLAGVAAALTYRVYESALAKGYPAGNLALMRDGNPSQSLDGGLGNVFRRYILYQWSGA